MIHWQAVGAMPSTGVQGVLPCRADIHHRPGSAGILREAALPASGSGLGPTAARTSGPAFRASPAGVTGLDPVQLSSPGRRPAVRHGRRHSPAPAQDSLAEAAPGPDVPAWCLGGPGCRGGHVSGSQALHGRRGAVSADGGRVFPRETLAGEGGLHAGLGGLEPGLPADAPPGGFEGAVPALSGLPSGVLTPAGRAFCRRLIVSSWRRGGRHLERRSRPGLGGETRA
jgi:hypothetical protein